jgi:hypothetical protein
LPHNTQHFSSWQTEKRLKAALSGDRASEDLFETRPPLASGDIFLYPRAFPIRRPERLSPQVSPVFPIKPGFEDLWSVADKVVNDERTALSLDDGLHAR